MRPFFLLIGLCFCLSRSYSQCQPLLLEITSQAQIDNFASQYPGCTRVDGSLRIQGKDIVSLEGLSQIETLMGELEISNTSLTSFYGLHNLDTILTSLNIIENSLITNMSGFEDLEYIHWQLYVYHNPALINFAGLNALTRIRTRLVIEGNNALQNFIGLSSLGYIGENFWIFKNKVLENFEGLDNLDTVKNYMLVDSNAITSMAGLDSLKRIGNNITVINNPHLVSFEGLSGLKYAKYLSIGHNASLTSLNGLGNIKEIENDIAIYNNPVLPSLEGLEVSHVSILNNLGLTDNPLLSYCALPWVCDYIEHNIGNIYGNAPGCQSGLEVREICLVDTENPDEDISVSVYPNPAYDFIYTVSPELEMQALVTGITGIVVLKETSFSGQLNIANLPAGMYVLHLKNSKAHHTSKFVKN